MKPKHIPQRKCVGCGEQRTKAELVRVVRTPDGTVTTDASGKLNGRGAYLCRGGAACLAKAIKARRFNRAFSCEVPAAVLEQLTIDN